MTTKSFINHRVLWLLIPLLTLFNLSAWAVDYTLMLTLDLASASDGSSTEITTDNGIKSFLQSAAPATTDIKSASIDGGKIYDAKGSGGDGIPDAVLKIGTASGAGSFSFTIADSYDNISKVVITGYGWKTTTEISINGSATQSPDTKLVERTFTYELGTASKTISVAVTTSAFCATEIKLYKTATPASKYTVSFSTGTGNPSIDDRAESTAGGGITLPSVTPACSSDGWALYGWATSAVASSTTTAPTIVGKAEDTYHPTGNTTLHAVYARGEYTKETSSITGGNYLIVGVNSGDNYLMSNVYSTYEYNSKDYGQLAGIQIDESNTTLHTYSAADVPANCVFSIVTASSLSVATGDWMIKNKVDNKYVSVDYASDLYLTWAEMDSGIDGNEIASSSNSWNITNAAYNGLYFDASDNQFYAVNEDYASDLLLYKETTTSYYWSSPTCVTCGANPTVTAASQKGSFFWTALFGARKPFCRAA